MTVAELIFTKRGAPKLQCVEICFRVENNLVPLLGIEPHGSLVVQSVVQSPHRMVCPIYNVKMYTVSAEIDSLDNADGRDFGPVVLSWQ